jgi:hypothetical protein
MSYMDLGLVIVNREFLNGMDRIALLEHLTQSSWTKGEDDDVS